MSDKSMSAAASATRPKVVFERTYRARVSELWELTVGRKRANDDRARSDARRRVYEDVDDGIHEPAHEAGQTVRGMKS